MHYFKQLPRAIVESIQNFPPSSIKNAARLVNFYLKDGTARNEVLVVGNEYYCMDMDKHKYFEPDEITLVEAAN